MPTDRPACRREVLLGVAGVAGAASLALAGCVGDDDDDATDDDTGAEPGDEADLDDEDELDDDGMADDDDECPDDDMTDETEDDDLPLTEEGSLPVDPADEEFVDLTGESAIEIETIQRDSDPQFVFDPPFVRVDEGTTIRWVNADGVFHTVTSTPSLSSRSGGGDVFDESFSSNGETIEWEAREAGRQDYYCSPHAGFMYGSIEIVD